MQIPTSEQCYQLMCEMEMMDHIVIHSMQVCRVASFIADQLNEQQNRLNSHLIQAAALLHDIGRKYETREQAQNTLFHYINGFYNPRCRYSYLGSDSSVKYESMAL